MFFTYRLCFPKLLCELLHAEVGIKGKGHIWSFFYDGERKIRADATNYSDLTRVKMNLNTDKGYVPIIEDISICEKEYLIAYKVHLKEIDQKIGYIKKDYENTYLKQLHDSMYQLYTQYAIQNDISQNTDEFFIFQLYTLKEQFEKYHKITSFSDAEICIFYLALHLFSDNLLSQFHEIQLFQTSYDKSKWEFVNIYTIQLENEFLYFMLEETKRGCNFYEITQQDVKHDTKSMNGLNKSIISQIKI